MAQKRKIQHNPLLVEGQAFFLKMLATPGYLSVLTGSPISRDDWQLLTEDQWRSNIELRRMVGIVQSICHVTEGHSGVANLKIPIEMAASVIRCFVKPVNWMGVCALLGDMGMRSLAQYEEQAVDVDAAAGPSGQEIFTFLFKLVSLEDTDREQEVRHRVQEALRAVGVTAAKGGARQNVSG